MTHTVRSVLGDTRTAEIHEGKYPWITCPFCGSGVYLGEPSPDHERPEFVARDGRCNNPWCLANPAMPIDAAREARGKAILQEQEEQKRRNLETWRRQDWGEQKAARQQAWDEIREETRVKGACVDCAAWDFYRSSRKRIVKHRGECPRRRS